jgi:hypothetical protein
MRKLLMGPLYPIGLAIVVASQPFQLLFRAFDRRAKRYLHFAYADGEGQVFYAVPGPWIQRTAARYGRKWFGDTCDVYPDGQWRVPSADGSLRGGHWFFSDSPGLTEDAPNDSRYMILDKNGKRTQPETF